MEDKFNEVKNDQYIRKTEIIVLLRRMRQRYIGDASESEIEASESLSTADEIFGGLINFQTGNSRLPPPKIFRNCKI